MAEVHLFNRFLVFQGAMLFFLMLFAPFHYVGLKVLLLTITIAITIVKVIYYHRLEISYPVFKWFSWLIFYGLFFTIIGFLNQGNNSGYILRASTVNILWPFLYIFLIVHVNSESVIRILFMVMVYATSIIGLYSIGATLNQLGMIPAIPFVSFDMAEMAIDPDNDNFQKITIPCLTSLIFLLPFVISILFLKPKLKLKVSNLSLLIAVLLGMSAVMFAARRILIINVLLTPVFLWILIRASGIRLEKTVKKRIKLALLYFIMSIVLLLYVLQTFEIVNLSALYNLFIAGFDFNEASAGESPYLRALQLNGLLKSWEEYPIFGQGHGTVSAYIVRSRQTPWIYELSYVALLFQTGMVGVLIYFGLIWWIFRTGIRIIAKDNEFRYFLLPVLVGAMSFLLANASNPYMQAYDHMWTLFLPVGLINAYILINERRKRDQWLP